MTWNLNSSLSITVSDFPLNLDDVAIESHLFCPKYLSGCDLLKLEGPRVECEPGDSVTYKLHVDPFCPEPVTWTYNPQSAEILDSNYAQMIFRFRESGDFVIKVEKNGCNKIVDSVIVSVGNDIPKINMPADTTLCLGNTMKLDAGNGYTNYLWQDGTDKESIVAADSGTYWVRLTDKNGCIHTDTTLIGSVRPLPYSFLPSDTVICASEFLELKPGLPL